VAACAMLCALTIYGERLEKMFFSGKPCNPPSQLLIEKTAEDGQLFDIPHLML